MFRDQKILAIIPARGGSKGLPRKNIKKLGDKPLIAWSIESAKSCELVDRVILSSEDSEIIEVAKHYGCDVPFIRPPELSDDFTSTNKVIEHALEQIPGFDWVMILQPTSPFRNSFDISECLKKSIDNNTSCVSACPTTENPSYMFFEQNGEFAPVMGWKYLSKRRQDFPPFIIPNGAIYACRIDDFLKHKTFYFPGMVFYTMPEERSIDIDTQMDWDSAESYLKTMK